MEKIFSNTFTQKCDKYLSIHIILFTTSLATIWKRIRNKIKKAEKSCEKIIVQVHEVKCIIEIINVKQKWK